MHDLNAAIYHATAVNYSRKVFDGTGSCGQFMAVTYERMCDISYKHERLSYSNSVISYCCNIGHKCQFYKSFILVTADRINKLECLPQSGF
jgi:hypothetical protein